MIIGEQFRSTAQNRRNSLYFSLLAGKSAPETGSQQTASSASARIETKTQKNQAFLQASLAACVALLWSTEITCQLPFGPSMCATHWLHQPSHRVAWRWSALRRSI